MAATIKTTLATAWKLKGVTQILATPYKIGRAHV